MIVEESDAERIRPWKRNGKTANEKPAGFFIPNEETPSMKQLEECRQILEDPNGYVKRLKAEGGRKIDGTYCS